MVDDKILEAVRNASQTETSAIATTTHGAAADDSTTTDDGAVKKDPDTAIV